MKYSILGEEKICQIYKDTEKALDKTVGHIVQLLDREKQTVATAESCTGGLLSQLITRCRELPVSLNWEYAPMRNG